MAPGSVRTGCPIEDDTYQGNDRTMARDHAHRWSEGDQYRRGVVVAGPYGQYAVTL